MLDKMLWQFKQALVAIIVFMVLMLIGSVLFWKVFSWMLIGVFLLLALVALLILVTFIVYVVARS
tara:strand:- start:3083 stop:3277 length:195 start_codon:yes stop_codon:yes gene_type:complete